MFALNLMRQNASQRIRTASNLIWNNKLRTQKYAKDLGPPATMNDLPIPEGCWKEKYSSTQTKYNITLLSGMVAAGAALSAVIFSGIINYNCTIPDYPYKTDEELEEEEDAEPPEDPKGKKK